MATKVRSGVALPWMLFLFLGLVSVSQIARAQVEAHSPIVLTVDSQATEPGDGSVQHPFGDLQSTRRPVQQLLAEGKSVRVELRPGFYQLDKVWEIHAEDSAPGAEVTYAAKIPGTAVILGGVPLNDWQEDPDHEGCARIRIPQSLQGKTSGPLWIQNVGDSWKRAVIARHPDSGSFHQLQDVKEEIDGTRAVHRLGLEEQDWERLKQLSEEQVSAARIQVHHKWDTTLEFLKEVNATVAQVSSVGEPMKPWNGLTPGCRYFLENIPAALDREGEWMIQGEWLIYRMSPQGRPSLLEGWLGQQECLLKIQGTPQRPVRNLRFEGLVFGVTGLTLPESGWPPMQAAMGVQAAAIQLDHVRDIFFDQCEIRHIGGTAIWFKTNCRRCQVTKTMMEDLGVGGIRIGETVLRSEEAGSEGSEEGPGPTGEIVIADTIIQSGGRQLPSAVGVWIGHSDHNRIEHCDIGDFYYTGISVGWRWGYQSSGAHHNEILFNHIHHLGYRHLSDMGGIYTLGPSEGTVVANNVVHEVRADRYGGWGLYPDEGSTGIRFENNLVYGVRDGGFHQHYGKENVVTNNVFAFSEEGQIAVTRAEPHLSFRFENNIVYWGQGELLGYGGWKNGVKVEMDHNLYWRNNGQPWLLAGWTWEQWQQQGHDKNSIIQDPGFVDPEHGDFRMKDDSIAREIGYQPWDHSQAGPRPLWMKAWLQGREYPEPLEIR